MNFNTVLFIYIFHLRNIYVIIKHYCSSGVICFETNHLLLFILLWHMLSDVMLAALLYRAVRNLTCLVVLRYLTLLLF